jgi:hypothetical protein
VTPFAMNSAYLTDITIMEAGTIAMILKDIFNDCKISVVMEFSCFNLILGCYIMSKFSFKY